MNRIPAGVVVAAAFSLATLGAVSARGQAASVEEQLKKIEKDRAAAVIKGDVATLESATADDYVFVNAYGQLSDKATTMNNIKTGNIKITANEVSDLKVRVYGDTAVVTGKASTKGTIGGRDVKSPMRFTRVYVKKDGKWQSVAFQQTPIVP